MKRVPAALILCACLTSVAPSVRAASDKSGDVVPRAEGEKPRAGQTDSPPPDGENGASEALTRVSNHVKEARNLLKGGDTGEKTRRLQGEILKELDTLINGSERPRPKQQSSARPQQSAKSSSPRPQDSPGGRSKNQASERPSAPTNAQAKASPGLGQEKRSGSFAPPGQKGKENKDKGIRITDLYKEVWGHLPESVRQEMDQYSREQFMPKYSELLKQYYATIAEKGRRKGD